MTESFRQALCEEAGALGILLTEEQCTKLFRYYEMLVEKNKVMNLTAITEESEVVTKHFVDSMAIVKTGEDGIRWEKEALEGKRLIDVGTGAGFPGLVLKIIFPELRITLSDSLKKRLVFLDEVIAELKLENICTLHGRAEDLAQDKSYREQFDFAVSRAVANLATLSEYDMPFVKKNGYFLAMKAGDVQEEVASAKKAVAVLGGKLEGIREYQLPMHEIDRSIVVIQKTKETPKIYPRKAGTPGKNPLK